ncbi:MAG: OB-fold nucleic acid binding domain-containing protein [Candidatus Hadarchaeum sp.]|uniref:OB-fold nucleic acid binding domain-containing protein n=1 Tax=Candidatus Hadarchaeum sp. TaxID=2883567 RepID=UPI003D0FDE94
MARNMAKLSLICSLVGLAAIYAAAISNRPRITPIASLNESFIGLRVSVSGQVIDYREHEAGHLFLKVKDKSGSLVNVPIFSRTRAQLEDLIELLDNVEITGEVALYQGEFEVIPEEAEDIKVVHTAPVALSEITEANAGSPAKVQGVISKREIVGSGNLVLTLQDDGNLIQVFIPSWIVEDGLPEVHVGDTVRVDGWVQLYNGKVELKLTSASHLHVIEDA